VTTELAVLAIVGTQAILLLMGAWRLVRDRFGEL